MIAADDAERCSGPLPPPAARGAKSCHITGLSVERGGRDGSMRGALDGGGGAWMIPSAWV